MSAKKHFVLDTNVLLHSNAAITCFADNVVVLPMTVIEELDKFKKNNDELGRNARQVIRTLDQLRGQGSLGKGVPTEDGGKVWITMEKEDDCGTCIDLNIPDNRIIATAYRLHKEGKRVIFVSKDINARLKADALGIAVMDFEQEKADFDQLYTGWRTIKVSASKIDHLYQGKELELADEEFLPNECVLLMDEQNDKHTAVGRASKAGSQLRPLNPVFDSAFNLRPRSMEQRVALELLMDPAVALVTMVGQAGTGKNLAGAGSGYGQFHQGGQVRKNAGLPACDTSGQGYWIPSRQQR